MAIPLVVRTQPRNARISISLRLKTWQKPWYSPIMRYILYTSSILPQIDSLLRLNGAVVRLISHQMFNGTSGSYDCTSRFQEEKYLVCGSWDSKVSKSR